MTSQRKNLLLVLSILAIAFVSCKKNNSEPLLLPENNQWILDSMQVYYYWADQLPKKPGANVNSVDFFKNLLNSADRFSYMEDPTNQPTSYSSFAYYGFEYALIEPAIFPGRLLGTVTLVVPGGPAARQGLKRGDLFVSVNGTEINNTTAESIKTTLKQRKDLILQITELTDGQLIETEKRTISSAYFREQPVYTTKLFGDKNKKTGYIFYNGFYEEFDRNILDSIAKFKNIGITDLILDLRYNPGGEVSSAAKIAATLAPVTSDQTFVVSQANKNGGRIIDSFAQSIGKSGSSPKDFAEISGSRITIERLYILTSPSTASSAELLINNLKPYLPVVQIGEKTIGKDMSSFAITDQRLQKKVPYVLHPLIFKLYNANMQGDYSKGIPPDYEVDEFNVLPLKAFGDNNDPLIRKALDLSFGHNSIASTLPIASKSEIVSRNTGSKVFFQSSVVRSSSMRPIVMPRLKSANRFNF